MGEHDEDRYPSLDRDYWRDKHDRDTFRLSDKKDARDVVKALEEMMEREDERRARMHWGRRLFDAKDDALVAAARPLIDGMDPADRKIVAETADWAWTHEDGRGDRWKQASPQAKALLELLYDGASRSLRRSRVPFEERQRGKRELAKAMEQGERRKARESTHPKYRLSSGKHAQEILACMEHDTAVYSATPEEEIGAMRWLGKVYTRTMSEEDKEILLRASRDRWGDATSMVTETRDARFIWQLMLARELRQGPSWLERIGGEELENRVRSLIGHSFAELLGEGNKPDVRDARSMAEDFLRRVEGLTQLHGDGAMEQHIAQAAEEHLAGLPLRYKARVIEHMLELEEQRLAESGAEPAEVEALREARDQRRAEAARLLKPKGDRGR